MFSPDRHAGWKCAALLGALWLAACGDLPRPLAPETKPLAEPLLLPPDRAGVLVTPIVGLPGEAGERLAEALAEALRNAEVPADTRARNAGSLLLVTAVRANDGGGQRIEADLYRPDGTRAARHAAALPRGAAPASRDAWSEPAREIALAMVAALATPVGRVAGPPKPIVIGAISGPPPQEANILARALAYNLQRARVAVAEAPNDEALQLAGEIAVAPKNRLERRLRIRWMIRQPDGSVVGDVQQENDVPVDLLERAWPEIALAIAEGAADGIANLLRQSDGGRP